jgi:DNA-binding transcriptional MerR regulator
MGMRDRETFELITLCKESGMDGPKIRRLYYSAAEVCQLADIKPHTLRMWEERFGMPRPTRNLNGRKLYRPGDLDATLRIKASKDAGLPDEMVLTQLRQSKDISLFELVETVHPHASSEQDRQWIDEIQAGLEEILGMVRKEDSGSSFL